MLLRARVVVIVGLFASFALSGAALADPQKAKPSGPSAAPGRNAISQAIGMLGSVRDYERLYWILHSIEQQPASERALLLQDLDKRILELTRVISQAPAEMPSGHSAPSEAPTLESLTQWIDNLTLPADLGERMDLQREAAAAIGRLADPNEQMLLHQRLQKRFSEQVNPSAPEPAPEPASPLAVP